MKAHTMKLALVAAAFLGLTGCVVVDHDPEPYDYDGDLEIVPICGGRSCLSVGATHIWIAIYDGNTLVAETTMDAAERGWVFPRMHEGTYGYDIHAYSGYNEIIWAADAPDGALEVLGGALNSYDVTLGPVY